MDQPGTAERIDVASIISEAASEEGMLETLADKEELSAEDLRGYLGDDAKDVSDDDLLASWKQTAGEGDGSQPAATPAATPVEGAAPSAPSWDRPWKFYKGEAAVEDVSKLTAAEALELAISYKAGGADQKRTVDELVRLAQRVPLDEQRISGLLEQTRNDARSLQELRQAIAQTEKDTKTWMWALQDPTGARFQKLQEAWFNSGPPEDKAAGLPDSSAIEREGEQLYRERIFPQLAEMARTYSPDGGTPAPEVVQHLTGELDRYFRELVEAEAASMGNPQYAAARLQQILQYDIPAELQRVGYRPAGRATARPAPTPTPTTPSAEVTSLKAQLTNLQTELAKQKVKNAPGPGAGVAAGATKGGPDFSKAKSYHDILDIMRSPETDWEQE